MDLHDIAALEQGRETFVFRVVTSPRPNREEDVEKGYEQDFLKLDIRHPQNVEYITLYHCNHGHTRNSGEC